MHISDEDTTVTFPLPTFLAQLANPDIKTVMLCGCGGGFDFVHSLVLYPYLHELGKTIVIGSYSFGEPENIGGAPSVFSEGRAVVKQVTASCVPDASYCPEVHVCSFLDAQFAEDAPHFIYAYYARAFTVATLSKFYSLLVERHQIDAIVLFDGGSDSLMRGDEDGLGDPVEDAISVASAASLEKVAIKLLVSVGMGADRFNNVSDAASLRAIAELTAGGGFRGAIGLEADHPGLRFYRDCIDYIYRNQTFRSGIVGMILSSVAGHFGGEVVPAYFPDRIGVSPFYIWPLMAILWGFDVEKVAQRSLMVNWIRDCGSPMECTMQIYIQRDQLGIRRKVENLPRHEDMRGHSR
jgi:hypothetical protein